jgi:hypothetical protein
MSDQVGRFENVVVYQMHDTNACPRKLNGNDRSNGAQAYDGNPLSLETIEPRNSLEIRLSRQDLWAPENLQIAARRAKGNEPIDTRVIAISELLWKADCDGFNRMIKPTHTAERRLRMPGCLPRPCREPLKEVVDEGFHRQKRGIGLNPDPGS